MRLLSALTALVMLAGGCVVLGDDDDDDDVPGSPTPPPSGGVDFCQVNFEENVGNNAATWNRYGILAFAPSWTSGTHDLGAGEQDFFAFIIYDMDRVGDEYVAGAILVSTSGRVTLDSPSYSLGQPISMSEHVASSFFNGDPDVTYPNATAGTATGVITSGVFNTYSHCVGSGDRDDCVRAHGSVQISVLGTDLSIGGFPRDSVYVFCADNTEVLRSANTEGTLLRLFRRSRRPQP